MNIELSPKAQQFIDAQIKEGRYSSASAAVNAVIEKEASPASLSEEEIVKRQREAFIQLRKELAALPPGGPDPYAGLSHDEVLYDKLQ